jgi:hypothetical protein
MATLLSQYNFVGCECEIWRSANSCFNQVILQQVEAIAYTLLQLKNGILLFTFSFSKIW